MLAAPFLPTPVDAKAVTAYFRGPPRDPRHARFRHLSLLAAIGWWADQVNDQVLRADVYLNIGVLADRYAAESGDPAFRQVARCTRARLIATYIELGRLDLVEQLARNLVTLYGNEAPPNSVEDWPLLVALRNARLEPAARSSIELLTTRAIVLATAVAPTATPERTSRLLAAASQGLLATGDATRAQQLAFQSLFVTGKPPEVNAAWRAMPVLYDSALALHGEADAASLQALLKPDQPPPSLNDKQAAFDSQLRLSMAAETREQWDDMTRLESAAFRTVIDGRGLERYPMPFYRHAIQELSATRSQDLATVAQHDPAFGPQTLATYQGLYDKLLAQAQNQFIGDAREQAFFQYKIDDNLHAQTALYPVMPRSQASIEDSTFRLAQLRSFGRLTLATLSAEITRSNVDPTARPDVERFFMMSTQSGEFLRARLDALRIVPGSPPPDGAALWPTYFALDVYQEETAHQYDKFVAFVRQKAPAVAELATPRPLPLSEFQRRLAGHEAIVATLVTPLDLYVWAITNSGVTLTRRPITERAVADKVRRLRASLTPGNGSLPAFDAAVAYELYQLVFEPSANALAGVTSVLWYGHGPLGAVPPAVLVTSPPAKAQLRTPAEFAATKFLVDRHAFAALADLSLFAWHRDRPAPQQLQTRFLGVGAPMLSAEELAGNARSRSYDLAGADGTGLAMADLARLPKLAESVDEMKGLAGAAGEANSTLWLGPDASERHFVGDQLRGYGTIALATHGFLPGEVKDVPEPALMLALDPASRDRFDGILTSREIAGLSLDANLVVLSACNTASADGRPRAETFTGLTQAFFMAGTRSMMVSHWPRDVRCGGATLGWDHRALEGQGALARGEPAAGHAGGAQGRHGQCGRVAPVLLGTVCDCRRRALARRRSPQHAVTDSARERIAGADQRPEFLEAFEAPSPTVLVREPDRLRDDAERRGIRRKLGRYHGARGRCLQRRRESTLTGIGDDDRVAARCQWHVVESDLAALDGLTIDQRLAAGQHRHDEGRTAAAPGERQVALSGNDARSRDEDRHLDRLHLRARRGARFAAPRGRRTFQPVLVIEHTRHGTQHGTDELAERTGVLHLVGPGAVNGLRLAVRELQDDRRLAWKLDAVPRLDDRADPHRHDLAVGLARQGEVLRRRTVLGHDPDPGLLRGGVQRCRRSAPRQHAHRDGKPHRPRTHPRMSHFLSSGLREPAHLAECAPKPIPPSSDSRYLTPQPQELLDQVEQ